MRDARYRVRNDGGDENARRDGEDVPDEGSRQNAFETSIVEADQSGRRSTPDSAVGVLGESHGVDGGEAEFAKRDEADAIEAEQVVHRAQPQTALAILKNLLHVLRGIGDGDEGVLLGAERRKEKQAPSEPAEHTNDYRRRGGSVEGESLRLTPTARSNRLVRRERMALYVG